MNTILNIFILLLTSYFKVNNPDLKHKVIEQKVIQKSRYFKNAKVIECFGDVNLNSVEVEEKLKKIKLKENKIKEKEAKIPKLKESLRELKDIQQ